MSFGMMLCLGMTLASSRQKIVALVRFNCYPNLRSALPMHLICSSRALREAIGRTIYRAW